MMRPAFLVGGTSRLVQVDRVLLLSLVLGLFSAAAVPPPVPTSIEPREATRAAIDPDDLALGRLADDGCPLFGDA